jgi:hypothetical protein
MNENTINISNKRVAFYGASIAMATVFFYSLIIMIYVIIRSSLTIYEILSSEVRTSILLQNGISVAYSIAIFSVIMAIISSIIGMITAIILKKSFLYFNPKFKKTNALLISGIIAISINGIVYFLMRITLKDWMTFNYIEPFLFWFLIPATIFLSACISLGGYFNGLLKLRNDVKIKSP